MDVDDSVGIDSGSAGRLGRGNEGGKLDNCYSLKNQIPF